MTTAEEPHDVRITERHASWAELFFDLVAVAGVAALAHALGAGLDARSLGLYALLFLAFWLSWTTFMLYGNVAAGKTRVIRMMVGMFGLGVMAASVPGVAHTVLEHGEGVRPLNVFAVAFVATRLYGSNSWRRGEVLLDFPVVQYSFGMLPWVASIWAPQPWKLTLWAVGIGLDLLLILVFSGSAILRRAQAEISRRGAGRRGPEIRGVSVDPAHLAERLGLFVIIVLGESVVQIVGAASGARYGVGLLGTGLASFVLLAGLFGLSVVYGYAGLPHLRPGHLAIRAALSLHCLVTGVVATVAVPLAAVVETGAEPLPGAGRWLLCGAIAAYFALGVTAGVASHSSDRQQTVSRIITGIVAPLLLGLFGAGLGGRTLVVCLTAVVLAHLFFERRTAVPAAAPARASGQTDGTPSPDPAVRPARRKR